MKYHHDKNKPCTNLVTELLKQFPGLSKKLSLRVLRFKNIYRLFLQDLL